MLPQRRILAVGIDATELARLCATWTVVARIDNRWQIDNEERGRTIARCTLRMPLGDALVVADREQPAVTAGS